MTIEQIREVIRKHDDAEISDYTAADMFKRLFEQHLKEEGGTANRLKHNGLLHRVHLWADVAIGLVAIVGIFWADLFNIFIQADLAFHVLIAALAFSGVIAERLLHKHKHSGVISA